MTAAIVQNFDAEGIMEPQTKSAPAGGGTPVTPGLAARKERLMTDRTAGTFPADHRETCKVFLDLAAQDLAKAKSQRVYYATLAHKYGLTNVEIGRHLRITEGAVRAMLAVDQ